MLWLVLVFLTALAVWLLLRPLLGGRLPFVEARPSELNVYRDQLKELETDLSRGLISAPEAEAARLEVKRKMLAVAPSIAVERSPTGIARRLRAALGVGVPVAAALLYASVGRPDLTSAGTPTALLLPSSPSEQPAAAQLPAVDTLVDRLAERLKTSPNDAKGWRMLGWSYAHLERYDDAATAFEKAVALDGRNADLRAQYGESVVRSAGGIVTPKAEEIFSAALAIDRQEPRARFFRGLALEQHGKQKEALAVWVELIRDGKADAEWMPDLRKRATDLAVKLKLDPATTIPGAPSIVAVSEPAGVATPARTELLSKALESDPKNLENWISLARAYRADGKVELARASLARAKEIFAGAPLVLQQIAAAEADITSTAGSSAGARGPSKEQVAAAADLNPEQRTAMINGMVEGLAERLRQNPNDLDGWLMLARSRVVMGDANAARTAIGRAEELFSADATARAKISQVATELRLN